MWLTESSAGCLGSVWPEVKQGAAGNGHFVGTWLVPSLDADGGTRHREREGLVLAAVPSWSWQFTDPPSQPSTGKSRGVAQSGSEGEFPRYRGVWAGTVLPWQSPEKEMVANPSTAAVAAELLAESWDSGCVGEL